ncbi:protein PTHB1 [Agrilus planipennis]|uniref:Protein PTHB1 n=1 Tax=Agrilus planipennis TaxID=224129 RepID=A0A1W4WKQ0_AGRPL|nr:protein PTHB1 [Agrilus planipennis]
MSLFQAIEFWTTFCDNEETFDQNSLKISRLNEQYDLIITGSHIGVLRIFKSGTEIDDRGVLQEFKPTDLLLEKDLQSAIIQVDVGKLVSGSQKIQIATLHSKTVKVCSFVTKAGETDHGHQYILKQIYEHKLRRTPSNFVIGPFGKSANRDFICVQSLDGLLTFFEQECFSFCCFLPKFLLPGPLVYLDYNDCFVTGGSTWMLQCFTYKALSDAGEASTQQDISGNKVTEEWVYNTGEEIFNMVVLPNHQKRDNFILALGHKHLYCCNGKGKLLFMKRLECPTSCFSAYLLGDDAKVVSLIVSETKTLLVYGNTTLLWAAQLSFLPVALSRASFPNIKGALVMLSEEGKHHCAYLGTEPHLFAAPPLSNQQLDLDKSEEELNRLYKIIRSRLSEEANRTSTSLEKDLVINLVVDPHLRTNIHPHNLESTDENEKANLMCHVSVELIPHVTFEELQLAVKVQSPLKTSIEAEFYTEVRETISFECDVFFEEALEVVSLEVMVVITCVSNVTFSRVLKKTATLPLKMAVQTCEPRKSGENRITLDLNKDALPLARLFPDFLGENKLSSFSNAVAFKNVNGCGEPVTILLAKSSQRYRLQSDSLSSLNIFLSYMKERLKQFYDNDPGFLITYSAALPVEPIVSFAREHFEIVQEIKRLLDLLTQLAAQYRAIEKRLITKFKDKNPTPVSQFVTLIDDTYEDINESLKRLKYEKGKLNAARNKLECSLNLLISLSRSMDISEDILQSIESVFEPHIYDIEGQSWEDTTDASLCYLLRTVLYKSEKDKLRTIHISFEEIKDFSKFEEHLTQVIERISSFANTSTTENKIEDEYEEIKNEPEQTKEVRSLSAGMETIGSQYGEASLRAISARKSLLKRRHKVSDV